MAGRKDVTAYEVPCPTCGSGPGDPCFMRRPPWEACAWPHKARRAAARTATAAEPQLNG